MPEIPRAEITGGRLGSRFASGSTMINELDDVTPTCDLPEHGLSALERELAELAYVLCCLTPDEIKIAEEAGK
ncbi:MAG: hypothetical protein ABSG78_17860 [Verrucomicrobiota bacterium]|jgi:hypothetical protein